MRVVAMMGLVGLDRHLAAPCILEELQLKENKVALSDFKIRFWPCRDIRNFRISRAMQDSSLLALRISSPQRGGAPSARQDGALLYPGPLCGGEAGTTGPQGSRQEVDSFSPAHGGAVEKPGSGSRTWRPWMGGKRQAGWPSLLVTYLLATQEISDSRAEGARKPLIYATSKRPAGSWQHTLCANASSDTANQEHRAQGALLQDRHLHHHARERTRPPKEDESSCSASLAKQAKYKLTGRLHSKTIAALLSVAPYLRGTAPWQTGPILQCRDETPDPSGRPFAQAPNTSTRLA